MRFSAFALAASVIVLGACGGKKDNAAADSSAAGATTTTADTTAPAAAGATDGAAAGGAAAAKPATGTTHEVKMLGDAQGYRFEPANVTVKAGDVIKFVNVSGGPHNAAFDPAAIPADVKPKLSANMPNQMSELAGPLLVNANEAYTISFAGIKPGADNYHSTPHLAMNMKAVITEQ